MTKKDCSHLHLPEVIAKASRARKQAHAKRKAQTISEHARRYTQMTRDEWRNDREETVGEYIAKGLVAGAAAREGKNHVLYQRELLDRTEGKARQKEPTIHIRKVEEIQRLPKDLSDIEEKEAWLRENGFDESADALLRGLHERSQRDEQPAE